MFSLDTFFLDSFPEDLHPLYIIPRGETGLSSPGGMERLEEGPEGDKEGPQLDALRRTQAE